tara:strand:+ start:9650 stop:10657 length:1008 start_codon:yes stop_codon:yes gene_type:complete
MSEGPQKILIGTEWNPTTTAAFYSQAFIDLGHDVKVCGSLLSDEKLKEWEMDELHHELKSPGVAAAFKYDQIKSRMRKWSLDFELDEMQEASEWADLFIWIDAGVAMDPPPGVPSICILGDLHLNPEWRLELANKYDQVYTQWERPPDASWGWLPAAVDPEVMAIAGHEGYCDHLGSYQEPRPYSQSKIWDVGFVGQTHPQYFQGRLAGLKMLGQNHLVACESLILQDMALLYARSHVGFNWSIGTDLNMRVMEVMATGTPLVTNNVPQLGELFSQQHVMVYVGLSELTRQVEMLLNEPALAETIGRSGQAEVLKHHTYRHRAAQLLQGKLEPSK